MIASIRVKVLYFGQAREAAGTGEEEVVLPGVTSVRRLTERSMESHRELRTLTKTLRVAVNEEMAGERDKVRDGDTVAFLPPVAGG